MSEHNYSIERDLHEATAMAQALVPYVYEDTLYRRVGGRILSKGGMPTLTLGALLMRLRRLRALSKHMDQNQLKQLAEAENGHNTVIAEWRQHYEGKLIREATSRLNDMKPFFDECREEPRSCASAYKPEALRRTIVQEILLMAGKLNVEGGDLRVKVALADGELRRFVRPGEFIWDAVLQPVYARDVFWWLYGQPG